MLWSSLCKNFGITSPLFYASLLTFQPPSCSLPTKPLCASIPWSWKVAMLVNVFLLALCLFLFLSVNLICGNLAWSHQFTLSSPSYVLASSLSSFLQVRPGIRIYAPKLLRTKAHTLVQSWLMRFGHSARLLPEILSFWRASFQSFWLVILGLLFSLRRKEEMGNEAVLFTYKCITESSPGELSVLLLFRPLRINMGELIW